MHLSGEYTFDAPQDLVWAALRDPAVLGSVMPGGQGFQEVNPDEYTGVLSVKVGPVQGSFNGKITLTDVVAPDSYNLMVEGSGAQGFVQGQGGLKLTPQGDRTHMAYQGDAKIGGKIASVGQRLVDASAKSIVRQSLEGLNAYLKAQVEQQAAAEAAPVADATPDPALASDDTTPPTVNSVTIEVAPTPAPYKAPTTYAPPSTYKPPSQTTLALNVAADVARDLIPAPYRPIVIGGIVVMVLAILWRLLR